MCHLCEERSYDGLWGPVQAGPEPKQAQSEKPAATGVKPDGIRLSGGNGNDSVSGSGKGPSR